MRATITATVLVIGLASAVTGCARMQDQHGHLVEPQQLAELQPGQQTKQEVLALLGSPSSRAPFDDNTWYYIGQRVEQFAFMTPEVTERNVLTLTFDDSGRLAGVDQLDASDGQEVALVSRETPTAGHELTFFEQLFGNLGRFSPAAGQRSGGNAPSPVPGY